MDARPAVLAIVATGVITTPSAAWAAQDDDDSAPVVAPPIEAGPPPANMSGFIVDIEATVLDIVSTVIDLDGATRRSERGDEVTVTLDASVFFDEEKHDLRRDSIRKLRRAVRQIKSDGARRLEIAGHTDALGTDEYNQGLSERRARAVETFLAGELPGVTMTSRGYGETEPVAPNETDSGDDNPDGRALNRRVEITYRR